MCLCGHPRLNIVTSDAAALFYLELLSHYSPCCDTMSHSVSRNHYSNIVIMVKTPNAVPYYCFKIAIAAVFR